MKVFALTDVGLKRRCNEDSIYACADRIGSLENLFILADGMGGQNAGDYASRFAVDSLAELLSKPCPEKDVHSIIKDGVQTVNRMLYEEAAKDEALYGMGTTMVAATVKNRLLYVANVGDSRLYLVRQTLLQVTKDHSLVEELVEQGRMSRRSANYRMNKNVITRALGTEKTVDTDMYAISLKPGDRLLLCSDGLSNMVDEFDMEYIIKNSPDLKTAGRNLVRCANENGGHDNISVILIDPEIGGVTA